MRYGGVSPVSARPRRPFGLLRRAGTRNAAFAAHEISRKHPDLESRHLGGDWQGPLAERAAINVESHCQSLASAVASARRPYHSYGCFVAHARFADAPFREAREAGVSCAAKAAFRVRRHGETRRVLAEAMRRPTKSRPGARPTAANRRQAIRHAAGFVVARSAVP